MGNIVKGYLVPPPPIIVPEVGKGEKLKCADTINSLKIVSSEISQLKPSTIIIITPHGPVFSDAIAISFEQNLSGSFKNFGSGYLNFSFNNNLPLAYSIIKECKRLKIPMIEIDKDSAKSYKTLIEIDHGALIPLYFINKFYTDYNIVHITIGFLSIEEMYFPKLIQICHFIYPDFSLIIK
jgi:aromatic ring-opening dioxygenase LigB subunit